MPISIIRRERFQRFSTFLNNLNNRKIFSFNRKFFRKTSDNHSLIFIRIITTSLYDRQNTLEYDGNSFNLIFQEIAWRNCSRNFGERIKSRANKQRTCVRRNYTTLFESSDATQPANGLLFKFFCNPGVTHRGFVLRRCSIISARGSRRSLVIRYISGQ